MSQPIVDRAVSEKSIAAVEDALRKGHPPIGQKRSGVFGAVTVAAEAMGVPVNTMRSRLKSIKQAHGLEPDWSLYNSPDEQMGEIVPAEAARNRRLEDQLADLRNRTRELERELATALEVREFITGFKSDLPKPKAWKISKSPITEHGTPLLIWSDWHIGETVFKNQVAGKNEYNVTVARQRVQTLVDKTVRLCYDRQAQPSYDEVVIALLGDMVSGTIHEELRETNGVLLTEQALECFEMIANSVRTLLDHFPRVRIHCVPGNHGRMKYKPTAKNKVRDNIEWLVYCFLQRAFADDERVYIEVSEDTEIIFDVAGMHILGMHGDATGAKGGDGFIGAVGPIVRGEKKVRDAGGFLDQRYDLAVMGHYHMELKMDGLIVNRTLKGYDEYAKNVLRARPERPGQCMVFIHPTEGVIDFKTVYV